MSDIKEDCKLNDNIEQILESNSINQNDTELTSNLQPLRKDISAKPMSGKCFMEILYSFVLSDFRNPYRKLNNEFSPYCCDSAICEEKHKKYNPKKTSSFMNSQLYNILDDTFVNWNYDLCAYAFSVLKPDQYFSDDIIRILFDYILNGPSENQMWDTKYILSSMFLEHAPCTAEMREFYLQLLSQPHNGESYFKTELTGLGVLYHVLNQLEQFYQQGEVSADKTQMSVCDISEEEDEEADSSCEGMKITFEILEERWKNHQSLLDEEINKVMDNLGKMSDKSLHTNEVAPKKVICLKRLTVALELIVDLFMSDLLICIAKLKTYLSDEHRGTEGLVPLIKHFMDCDFKNRIFRLYATTKLTPLLRLLSKLISVMAEHVHLFTPPILRLWQYPHLHHGCMTFFCGFFDAISQCEWSKEEKLLRLRMIAPPWLQLLVAMKWVNTELSIQIGADLEAVVETIHMHVQSPVKFEKGVKEIKSQHIVVTRSTNHFSKRALKRNYYGETRLHILCKKKGSTLQLEKFLAIPDIDINAKDNYGWTPLHESVLDGLILKTKLLLKYQPPPGKMPVDIGAQNCRGVTALHIAVHLGNLAICQLLVDYGGASLLRKTDCEGITPLELSKTNKEINKYFNKVLKLQEEHNLSPDSILNLPEFVIELLIVACNAYISDRFTADVDRVMKFSKKYKKETYNKWIVLDKDTLLKFRSDQLQFIKLRRILKKLAENPKNSPLIRLWDSQFQNVSEVQNLSQPTAFSSDVSKNITDNLTICACRQLIDKLLHDDDLFNQKQ